MGIGNVVICRPAGGLNNPLILCRHLFDVNVYLTATIVDLIRDNEMFLEVAEDGNFNGLSIIRPGGRVRLHMSCMA